MSDNNITIIEEFDIQYRVKCEEELTTTLKRVKELETELEQLGQVVCRLQGGIYVYEQYLKEKYSLGENPHVDAMTGVVTYK